MKSFFRYIGIKKCSLCNKRKFYLYNIPIYNDISEIIDCDTKESYLTCWKCIHKLLQKHIVIISMKSFVKRNTNDMSVNSQNTMNNLIKSEKYQNSQNFNPEFYNYANYLTDEEHQTLKTLIHKINKKTMC